MALSAFTDIRSLRAFSPILSIPRPVTSPMIRPVVATARPVASPVIRPVLATARPSAAAPARPVAFEGSVNLRPAGKPSVVGGATLQARSGPMARVNVPRVATPGFLPGGDKRGPLNLSAARAVVPAPGRNLLGPVRGKPQSSGRAAPAGLEKIAQRSSSSSRGLAFEGSGRRRGEMPLGLERREVAKKAAEEKRVLPRPESPAAAQAAAQTGAPPSGLVQLIAANPVTAAGVGVAGYFGLKALIAALA